MVIHGGRSVEQHCKQVLLDVVYLGGVLLQTVHDKLDVRAVQLQKAGAYNFMRKVRTRDPGGLSFGTDRFYQQLYDLIQVIQVERITLLQTVILYGASSIPRSWMNALRGKDVIERCLF